MDGGKSEREIPSRGVILGIRGWAGYGEGWVSCCCPLTFYDSHYSVSLPTDCCVLSLAGACVKCSKGVFGAGQACQAMGNLYHDACFTCAACSECVGVWGGAQGEEQEDRGGRRWKSILPGDTWPMSLRGSTGRQDSVF